MFGISFGELMLIATVALLVVGPQKLPQMLRTLGNWIARMRRVMTDVRSQSGIDDILRHEGLEGGLSELRSIMKGGGGLPLAARAFQSAASSSGTPAARRGAVEAFAEDRSREYPVEGPDAQGALPEDLLPKPPKAAPPADELLVVPPGATPPETAPARASDATLPSGPPRPDKPRTLPPPSDGDKTPGNAPQPALGAVSTRRQAT
ncbi:MAG: Sec-independent protein translocase protein TatB [Polyangiaceae bacterium]